MDDKGIEEKKPQKDKISDALENLDRIKRRANMLMERLLNGIQPVHEERLEMPPPNEVIFASLWDCLPDQINHCAQSFDDIFTELETRLLN
jgi:hypothetical protein